jgi:hypothetical protein
MLLMIKCRPFRYKHTQANRLFSFCFISINSSSAPMSAKASLHLLPYSLQCAWHGHEVHVMVHFAINHSEFNLTERSDDIGLLMTRV